MKNAFDILLRYSILHKLVLLFSLHLAIVHGKLSLGINLQKSVLEYLDLDCREYQSKANTNELAFF